MSAWRCRKAGRRNSAPCVRRPTLPAQVPKSSARARPRQPSRIWAWMLMSGESVWNVATASGRPAITPGCRAIRIAWAGVVSGMVAIEVISPARPRSSLSARRTASSIASGDRKLSGCSSEAGVVISDQAIIGCAGRAGIERCFAISRAAASVVMVRWASVGCSAGQSMR